MANAQFLIMGKEVENKLKENLLAVLHARCGKMYHVEKGNIKLGINQHNEQCKGWIYENSQR